MSLAIILGGLVIGILFGLALQRGRLCFNSAIRDPLIFKDYTLIKAVFMAIAVSMIGFAIMGFAGFVPAPKPFMPIAQLVGGFVFGMGMVLAAACASGVTYKTGEGIMVAFVGLLGLALGGFTAKSGALMGAKDYLQNLVKVNGLTWIGVLDTTPVTGNLLLYLIVMMLAGVVFTALMTWKFMLPAFKEWRAAEQGGFVDIFFKKGWPWWMTGIIVAIINISAWAVGASVTAAEVVPYNYPLGITGGWIAILSGFTTGTADALASLPWLAWVVMGLIFGSFVGAKGAGEYKMSSPKTGKPIMLAFIGGLMLGVGAVFSAGCNITNLLSGIPLLSVGSLTFTVFCFLGVWFMAYLIFKVLDKSEILE